MCLCDVECVNTLSLACGHRFCSDCWRDYICSTISNKSFNSIFIKCPGYKCHTPLSNKIIKQFLNDKHQWNKYENYIVQHFITSNEQKYRFCPSPGCNFIIFCNDSSPKSLICGGDAQCSNNNKGTKRVTKYKQQQQQQQLQQQFDGFKFFGQSPHNEATSKTKMINVKKRSLLKLENGHSPSPTFKRIPDYNGREHQLNKPTLSAAETSLFVQCRCGFDFCFLCGQEYHGPATCKQVELWNFKCLKESDNAQWIVTNTKV